VARAELAIQGAINSAELASIGAGIRANLQRSGLRKMPRKTGELERLGTRGSSCKHSVFRRLRMRRGAKIALRRHRGWWIAFALESLPLTF